MGTAGIPTPTAGSVNELLTNAPVDTLIAPTGEVTSISLGTFNPNSRYEILVAIPSGAYTGTVYVDLAVSGGSGNIIYDYQVNNGAQSIAGTTNSGPTMRAASFGAAKVFTVRIEIGPRLGGQRFIRSEVLRADTAHWSDDVIRCWGGTERNFTSGSISFPAAAVTGAQVLLTEIPVAQEP